EMPVKVFFTSVSGSTQIKKNQDRIFSILSAKKIPFQPVDISQSSDDKDLMRQGAGDPTALPPQIFNGDVYCGVRGKNLIGSFWYRHLCTHK
uniref:Uncharacterized protein n=1 Tax=Oreochromis niloticus TaxID=8128 RepID=A0A669CAZ1_ORENI